MINQYEVASYLADEFPEIKQNLSSTSPKFNVFKSIQCLTDYTRINVIRHDLKVVKKCFSVAENIYVTGNDLIKDAIENIFIYSFSALLNLGGKDDKKQLHALMPICLYSAYVRQILKSGI